MARPGCFCCEGAMGLNTHFQGQAPISLPVALGAAASRQTWPEHKVP